MPSQTELSLQSLLPTVPYLPPELVTLSNSLISQSRAKAASLKPEEEVARTYVCCHIACERLGNKLALDVGQPRPPVKPRVYDKLKVYFNSVLKTTNPSTPRTKRIEDKIGNVSASRPGTGGAGSSSTTPSKDVITPSSVHKRASRNSAMPTGAVAELPKFVMPLIRYLCKEYEVPDAVPHVFAGVCSVIGSSRGDEASAKRRKVSHARPIDDRDPLDDVPAVVTALFAITYDRMYAEHVLEDDSQRNELVATVEEYCRHHAGRLGLEAVTDIGLGAISVVEEYAIEWRAMEFYQNIPEATGEAGGEAQSIDGGDEVRLLPTPRFPKTPLHRKEKHAGRPRVADDTGAAGLLPGLGTMFQPALDWLSDERCADYAQWKRSIVRQLELVEQR